MILEELEGVPETGRTARFACALAIADASGSVLFETEGDLPGKDRRRSRAGRAVSATIRYSFPTATIGPLASWMSR